MKSTTIKHLGFALMLLPLCALFLGSNCNDKSCWSSAKNLEAIDHGDNFTYYGDYQVSEVYDYSGGTWNSLSFKEVNTNSFGNSYIRVDPDDIFTSGDVVRISGKKYTASGYTIADIESYNEVLDSLEKCTCEDGSCDWEYREFGIWGFPGVGQEDMNVKINFSMWDYTMQLTFTDSNDTTRNFILVCHKIL